LLQVWREGSPEYPFHLGFAARNGVVAAELAAAGAQAGQFMLEGPEGLYAAAAGVDRPPVEALAGLGHDWQISEVTVKPFPACAVLQGPLEVALRLREASGGTRVEAVRLALSPFEATFPGIDNAGPAYAGPTAAKMSAQFCLGAAFANGRLSLADLSRTEDAAILDAARRVSVWVDPGLRDRQCRLDVSLVDGRSISGGLDGPVGRPDFAGVAEFARRLAPEMGATMDAVDRLVAEVAEIETRATLRPLLAAVAALRV
jgi:2-methylcitrate dehydratase PrpD